MQREVKQLRISWEWNDEYLDALICLCVFLLPDLYAKMNEILQPTKGYESDVIYLDKCEE